MPPSRDQAILPRRRRTHVRVPAAARHVACTSNATYNCQRSQTEFDDMNESYVRLALDMADILLAKDAHAFYVISGDRLLANAGYKWETAYAELEQRVHEPNFLEPFAKLTSVLLNSSSYQMKRLQHCDFVESLVAASVYNNQIVHQFLKKFMDVPFDLEHGAGLATSDDQPTDLRNHGTAVLHDYYETMVGLNPSQAKEHASQWNIPRLKRKLKTTTGLGVRPTDSVYPINRLKGVASNPLTLSVLIEHERDGGVDDQGRVFSAVVMYRSLFIRCIFQTMFISAWTRHITECEHVPTFIVHALAAAGPGAWTRFLADVSQLEINMQGEPEVWAVYDEEFVREIVYTGESCPRPSIRPNCAFNHLSYLPAGDPLRNRSINLASDAEQLVARALSGTLFSFLDAIANSAQGPVRKKLRPGAPPSVHDEGLRPYAANPLTHVHVKMAWVFTTLCEMYAGSHRVSEEALWNCVLLDQASSRIMPGTLASESASLADFRRTNEPILREVRLLIFTMRLLFNLPTQINPNQHDLVRALTQLVCKFPAIIYAFVYVKSTITQTFNELDTLFFNPAHLMWIPYRAYVTAGIEYAEELCEHLCEQGLVHYAARLGRRISQCTDGDIAVMRVDGRVNRLMFLHGMRMIMENVPGQFTIENIQTIAVGSDRKYIVGSVHDIGALQTSLALYGGAMGADASSRVGSRGPLIMHVLYRKRNVERAFALHSLATMITEQVAMDAILPPAHDMFSAHYDHLGHIIRKSFDDVDTFADFYNSLCRNSYKDCGNVGPRTRKRERGDKFALQNDLWVIGLLSFIAIDTGHRMSTTAIYELYLFANLHAPDACAERHKTLFQWATKKVDGARRLIARQRGKKGLLGQSEFAAIWCQPRVYASVETDVTDLPNLELTLDLYQFICSDACPVSLARILFRGMIPILRGAQQRTIHFNRSLVRLTTLENERVQFTPHFACDTTPSTPPLPASPHAAVWPTTRDHYDSLDAALFRTAPRDHGMAAFVHSVADATQVGAQIPERQAGAAHATVAEANARFLAFLIQSLENIRETSIDASADAILVPDAAHHFINADSACTTAPTRISVNADLFVDNSIFIPTLDIAAYRRAVAESHVSHRTNPIVWAVEEYRNISEDIFPALIPQELSCVVAIAHAHAAPPAPLTRNALRLQEHGARNTGLGAALTSLDIGYVTNQPVLTHITMAQEDQDPTWLAALHPADDDDDDEVAEDDDSASSATYDNDREPVYDDDDEEEVEEEEESDDEYDVRTQCFYCRGLLSERPRGHSDVIAASIETVAPSSGSSSMAPQPLRPPQVAVPGTAPKSLYDAAPARMTWRVVEVEESPGSKNRVRVHMACYTEQREWGSASETDQSFSSSFSRSSRLEDDHRVFATGSPTNLYVKLGSHRRRPGVVLRDTNASRLSNGKRRYDDIVHDDLHIFS